MDQPEMKHDHRDLRATLGRYATGVTVITAMHGERPVGITVNSFASLSLDPALILSVLQGCLAMFACQKYALHDAGDHTLIIGKVLEFSKRDGDPLIFLDGNFLA